MEDNFAYRLFRLMNDRDLSSIELSKSINVSNATINNWLNGKSLPNKLKFILVLSDYFNVPPSYFWNVLKKGK